MKYALFIIIVLLHTTVASAQKDCTVEEWALLQDKPDSISHLQALSLIKGEKQYIGLAGNFEHYLIHIQTFPFPKDGFVKKIDKVTIGLVEGKANWIIEPKALITDKDEGSLNKTLLMWIVLSFCFGLFFWLISENKSLLLNIRIGTLVNLVLNVVIWIFGESMGEYVNFTLLDFFLRIIYFEIVIILGLLLGLGLDVLGRIIKKRYSKRNVVFS